MGIFLGFVLVNLIKKNSLSLAPDRNHGPMFSQYLVNKEIREFPSLGLYIDVNISQ